MGYIPEKRYGHSPTWSPILVSHLCLALAIWRRLLCRTLAPWFKYSRCHTLRFRCPWQFSWVLQRWRAKRTLKTINPHPHKKTRRNILSFRMSESFL
jgi:hypothetical protein